MPMSALLGNPSPDLVYRGHHLSPPHSITTEMSTSQATLSLRPYDCAAFTIHLAHGVFGEAGSPWSFPSVLWDHLPRELEHALRKQGGSPGRSLLPRTLPCSLLIILKCTCGLLLPQRIASIFSSKDVLQIFTKDGKAHCPQTVSVFYLEKLQRENTERPAVGLLDREAREEYKEKGTC